MFSNDSGLSQFDTAISAIYCTTWTLTKRLKKKLDGNYIRMLRAITKTIQVRRTRHSGHCWRSRDELISDVLRWTPACGQAKARRPARTDIQQLCEDTGRSPENLPEAMNDREKWRERVRDIRASGTTWWWWWWWWWWWCLQIRRYTVFTCAKVELWEQVYRQLTNIIFQNSLLLFK